jgi:hypothetical protein
MDSDGVRIPLSKRKSFITGKINELLDRTRAIISNQSLDLHFFGSDLDTNNLENNFLNTNLDRSLDRSLDNSPKRLRRRKRLRSDDEEEESPEGDQERVKIIELGQVNKERFACPFEMCDPGRYRSSKNPGFYQLIDIGTQWSG